MADGDQQQRLVDVGRNDMALLGEVLRTADDVVAAFADFGDESQLQD